MEVYPPAVCEPVDILTYTAQISGCIATFEAVLAGTAPFEYLWNFGTFGAYTTVNPVVNFQATGTYTGTLWAWNCTGQYSDTMALEVRVECAPPVHHYIIYLPLVLRNG